MSTTIEATDHIINRLVGAATSANTRTPTDSFDVMLLQPFSADELGLSRVAVYAMRWAAHLLDTKPVVIGGLIRDERARQEALHPDGFNPEVRGAVLLEEVGEVATAIIEGGEDPSLGAIEDLVSELVQVAAVGARWLEATVAECGDDE